MPGGSDDELIKELFENHRDMMLKIALRILGNKSDAEDSVQDAFVRLMSNLEKISQMSKNERAFFCASVIKNVSLNCYKKKNRHPYDDIDEHYMIVSDYSVEKKADENFLLDEIKLALKELSDRDYSIIYLCFFEQMTPKEIAGALDISEKNIHKYIDRAKERFIKILNERGINYDL